MSLLKIPTVTALAGHFSMVAAIALLATAITSAAPIHVAAGVSAGANNAAPLAGRSLTSNNEKCGSPSNPCPTCTVEISTVALTPLVVYDGSGGNILFSAPEPTEAKCDHEAIAQWNNALSTGWSPANRCAIIAGTGPSDEILTEITYIYNGNPSVRSDGYAVMCSHSVNVPNVPAY
jgi:hypothetical protein